jgi:folate-dependent phosphoribosylglycinamide formyltransferase PurN
VKKPWIAFFSQTGTEIVDIAKSLGKWPDMIITNQRPEHLRKINSALENKNLVFVDNKPTEEELSFILGGYDNPLVTLHGWLRIMPPSICEKYQIFNGHPGLITEYPELKGKDPQIRAFEGKYPIMGCVLHRVTAGVDEGRVVAEERFNAFQITEEEMWKVTRDRSLYLWIDFLKLTLAI